MTNGYFRLHYRQIKSRAKKGKKLNRKRKSLLGMFAFGALGAEADEPVGAHDLSNVATFAVRPVLAETARVPGTLLYF